MQLKKIWIPATLSMMLAFPAAGVYAQISSLEENSTLSQEWEDHHKDHDQGHHMFKGYKHHHGFMINTHRAAYYTLLAEKHTPESLQQWKDVLSEREILIKEFKAIGMGHHKKFQEAKEKVKKGEITEDRLKEQIKEWKEERRGQHKNWKENWKQIKEEHQAIHQEFTRAIESNDSKQISNALPKLLQLLQKENKIIKTNLDELKSKEN